MYRVIIIDDEYHIRKGVGQMLKGVEGVDCVGSCEGVETALELIRELKPDIVLSDVNLKDGSIRKLLEYTDLPGFQLILMTASSESSIRDLKKLAVKILFKPFTIDELNNAVIKAVGIIKLSE